jgi:hypothetical protein
MIAGKGFAGVAVQWSTVVPMDPKRVQAFANSI